MKSILISIKKLLGLDQHYKQFDQDIIMHINSVFSILNQLGVGPEEGFSIYSEEEEWSDFIQDNAKIEMVKTYIYMKVRLMFDPPQNSSVTEVMKSQISELEWRLNVQVDPGKEKSNE